MGRSVQPCPDTETTLIPESYVVALGEVASIEIGTEVKILAKAMIKQVDRVGTDMINQVAEFKRSNPKAICVGIVGVNSAPIYRGLEGGREYVTTGKGGHPHPIQEAAQAEQRIFDRVSTILDELIRVPLHRYQHAAARLRLVERNANRK